MSVASPVCRSDPTPTAWRDFAGQLTPDQRARFERMDTAGVPDADAALAAAMLELALELGGLR